MTPRMVRISLAGNLLCLALGLGAWVGPNVQTSFNPTIATPTLQANSIIHPMASVMGSVKLGKRVFVAPFASIRGDEGQHIHIGNESNVQDGVVIHGLETFEAGREIVIAPLPMYHIFGLNVVLGLTLARGATVLCDRFEASTFAYQGYGRGMPVEALQTEHVTRSSRRQGLRRVALCGYTNAGKSTLLNALTDGATRAENKLFATLDPVSRRLRFPDEREVIFTDTVGFIRDLPHKLVEAFRATLQEAAEADLLLHVVDASSPNLLEQCAEVERVLAEIGAGQVAQLLVYNKCDLLEPSRRPRQPVDCIARADGTRVQRVFVSARDGGGLAALRDVLAAAAGAHANGAAPAMPPWPLDAQPLAAGASASTSSLAPRHA